MSEIDIDWGNVEETLLIITFQTGWNFEDYSEGLKKLQEIVLSKSHDVHLFFDFQMLKSVPRDLPRIINHGHNFMIDNVGLIVVITSSSVWTKLYRSFQHLLPSHVQLEFADNTDVAYALLRERMS